MDALLINWVPGRRRCVAGESGVMASRPTIKQLPPEGRPRERLVAEGPRALSLAELLAVIIRTGNPATGETAIDLAQRLLGVAGSGSGGLSQLLNAGVEELSRIPGIGIAKAAQVRAALELGRRMAGASDRPVVVAGPEDVWALLRDDLGHREQEHLQVVLLSIRNGVLGVETVAVGGLSSSVITPREIFRPAIRRNAAAIVLAHNHPSGDVTPSSDDIMFTGRVIAAGEVVGIAVLDHLIIGNDNYTSLRETPRGWDLWTTGKGEPGR